MKGALISAVIVLLVSSVLTGGFGLSVGTSLMVCVAILFVLNIMSAIKGGNE